MRILQGLYKGSLSQRCTGPSFLLLQRAPACTTHFFFFSTISRDTLQYIDYVRLSKLLFHEITQDTMMIRRTKTAFVDPRHV